MSPHSQKVNSLPDDLKKIAEQLIAKKFPDKEKEGWGEYIPPDSFRQEYMGDWSRLRNAYPRFQVRQSPEFMGIEISVECGNCKRVIHMMRLADEFRARKATRIPFQERCRNCGAFNEGSLNL